MRARDPRDSRRVRVATATGTGSVRRPAVGDTFEEPNDTKSSGEGC